MVVTLLCPLELPLKGVFFDMEMYPQAGCKAFTGIEPDWRLVLSNKHLAEISSANLNFYYGTKFSFSQFLTYLVSTLMVQSWWM